MVVATLTKYLAVGDFSRSAFMNRNDVVELQHAGAGTLLTLPLGCLHKSASGWFRKLKTDSSFTSGVKFCSHRDPVTFARAIASLDASVLADKFCSAICTCVGCGDTGSAFTAIAAKLLSTERLIALPLFGKRLPALFARFGFGRFKLRTSATAKRITPVFRGELYFALRTYLGAVKCLAAHRLIVSHNTVIIPS